MYNFSADQLAIMSLYRTGSKEELVADLQEALPHVDDLDVLTEMTACIATLEDIPDEDFQRLTFVSELI